MSNSKSLDWLGFAALAGVVVLVLYTMRRSAAPEAPMGMPMPALKAAGWLNVPKGEAFDPTGKIVYDRVRRVTKKFLEEATRSSPPAKA